MTGAVRPVVAATALATLVEPAVEAAGFDLEQIETSRVGRRQVVRVVVDRDGGVSLDDVAEISRTISAVLDRHDGDVAPTGPFVLEVTSPGVDRPLAAPRHWRRATGRLVTARLAGGEVVSGRLRTADDDPAGGVTFDVGASGRQLRYADVVRANVQVEFKSAESGGSPGRQRSGSRKTEAQRQHRPKEHGRSWEVRREH